MPAKTKGGPTDSGYHKRRHGEREAQLRKGAKRVGATEGRNARRDLRVEGKHEGEPGGAEEDGGKAQGAQVFLLRWWLPVEQTIIIIDTIFVEWQTGSEVQPWTLDLWTVQTNGGEKWVAAAHQWAGGTYPEPGETGGGKQHAAREVKDGDGGWTKGAVVVDFLKLCPVFRVKERVKKMSAQMKHDEERRKSLQVDALTALLRNNQVVLSQMQRLWKVKLIMLQKKKLHRIILVFRKTTNLLMWHLMWRFVSKLRSACPVGEGPFLRRTYQRSLLFRRSWKLWCPKPCYLAAHLTGSGSGSDFVARQRRVAVREFGNSLILHSISYFKTGLVQR